MGDEETHRLQLGSLIGRPDVDIKIKTNAVVARHMAILAMTGGGKTVAARQIIGELLRAGYPLLILDPHGDRLERLFAVTSACRPRRNWRNEKAESTSRLRLCWNEYASDKGQALRMLPWRRPSDLFAPYVRYGRLPVGDMSGIGERVLAPNRAQVSFAYAALTVLQFQR